MRGVTVTSNRLTSLFIQE